MRKIVSALFQLLLVCAAQASALDKRIDNLWDSPARTAGVTVEEISLEPFSYSSEAVLNPGGETIAPGPRWNYIIERGLKGMEGLSVNDLYDIYDVTHPISEVTWTTNWPSNYASLTSAPSSGRDNSAFSVFVDPKAISSTDSPIFEWHLTPDQIKTIYCSSKDDIKTFHAKITIKSKDNRYPDIRFNWDLTIKLPILPQIVGYYDLYWLNNFTEYEILPLPFGSDMQRWWAKEGGKDYCFFDNNLMNSFVFDNSANSIQAIVKNIPECGSWDIQFAYKQSILNHSANYSPGDDNDRSTNYDTGNGYRIWKSGGLEVDTRNFGGMANFLTTNNLGGFKEIKEKVVGNGAVLGDVDGSGEINMVDVTILVDYLLGRDNGSFILDNADVNKDGIITNSDVVALIQQLLPNLIPWQDFGAYQYWKIPFNNGKNLLQMMWTSNEGDNLSSSYTLTDHDVPWDHKAWYKSAKIQDRRTYLRADHYTTDLDWQNDYYKDLLNVLDPDSANDIVTSNGTTEPRRTHTRPIDINVWGALNAWNYVPVKTYKAYLIAPLRINRTNNEVIWHDGMVDGSPVNWRNLLTLTDFRGYLVADVADGTYSSEQQRWTKSLWNYYEVQGIEVGQALFGLRVNDSYIVIDPTNWISRDELYIRTNGNFDISFERNGDMICFRNNGGFRIDKAVKVRVPVTVKYGLGKLDSYIEGWIYPQGM